MGRAALERRSIQTVDLLTDPAIQLSPASRARIEAAGSRALVAVPIVIRTEVLGVLAVYHPPGTRIPVEETEFLRDPRQPRGGGARQRPPLRPDPAPAGDGRDAHGAHPDPDGVARPLHGALPGRRRRPPPARERRRRGRPRRAVRRHPSRGGGRPGGRGVSRPRDPAGAGGGRQGAGDGGRRSGRPTTSRTRASAATSPTRCERPGSWGSWRCRCGSSRSWSACSGRSTATRPRSPTRTGERLGPRPGRRDRRRERPALRGMPGGARPRPWRSSRSAASSPRRSIPTASWTSSWRRCAA